MRVACLLLPDLPLAAELRARPELVGEPFAVASGPGPRAEILAVSPEATRQGVCVQTTVAHARALCGALRVQPVSHALERAARAALLDVALSCSPRAALAPRAAGAYAGEAAAYLDASGTLALFESEAGLAAALTARARGVGLPAGELRCFLCSPLERSRFSQGCRHRVKQQSRWPTRLAWPSSRDSSGRESKFA